MKTRVTASQQLPKQGHQSYLQPKQSQTARVFTSTDLAERVAKDAKIIRENPLPGKRK